MLDSLDAPDFLEASYAELTELEVVCGVPAPGWDVVVADANELEQAADAVWALSSGPFIIGGFSRHDCVARFSRALSTHDASVSWHGPAVLPLDAEASAWWRSSLALAY